MMTDHRVLYPGLGIAREHYDTLAGVEARRVNRVEHFYPPVLGPGGGTAHVQAPPAGRTADQSWPLQGFCGELLTSEGEYGLKPDAVGRACHLHGIAAPGPERATQPVRDVNAVLTHDRARRTRPVPRPGLRRGGHELRLVRTRQQQGEKLRGVAVIRCRHRATPPGACRS